ncbi:hypothetical protein D6D01_03345 [Aureobasidium pullulans]|uniref:Uncharacterized protein n=1 Tax=Aureobasidium pullulans TaxID=5580 RepID=A0A4S9LM25_AURPU|nr:hypothetical protein D6D01_03345 [Aureobasidium pullulans]
MATRSANTTEVRLIINGNTVLASCVQENTGSLSITVAHGCVNISTPTSQTSVFTQPKTISISTCSNLATVPLSAPSLQIGGIQQSISFNSAPLALNTLVEHVRSDLCTCVAGKKCPRHLRVAQEKRRRRRERRQQQEPPVGNVKKHIHPKHTNTVKQCKKKSRKRAGASESFDQVVHGHRRITSSKTVKAEPESDFNTLTSDLGGKQDITSRAVDIRQFQHDTHVPDMIGLPTHLPGEDIWAINNSSPTGREIKSEVQSGTTSQDTSIESSLSDVHGKQLNSSSSGHIIPGFSLFTSSGEWDPPQIKIEKMEDIFHR